MNEEAHVARTHPWQRVSDDIRDAIERGELAVGDPVPTEEQLSDQHKLGRGAIRNALRDLQSHGLITAARGSQGRRVREFDPRIWNLSRFELGERRDDPDRGVDEWAADMRAQGCEPAETVQVFNKPAPVRAANLLDLEIGTRVYMRRRFRYADAELISIADTWMPEWVAERPATSTNGDYVRDEKGKVLYPFTTEESVSLPGGLIRAVGLRQSWIKDVHYSRYPSPTEATMLGTSDPVSDIARIGYDTNEQPFRVMLSVSPGDKLAAQYVLKVEEDE